MVTRAQIDELKSSVEALGGKVDEVVVLEDGSGFATAELPLPEDHWLNLPGRNTPPMPMRLGTFDEAHHKRVVEAIHAAGKYALRASTMNGRTDYDPDAVLQNLVVGLIGYFTPDGLSEDRDENPMHHPELTIVPAQWSDL